MSVIAERAELWEAERPRLTALAYRILGSWQDAEDVVAAAWPRLAEQEGLERPEAWLTTVVTRLAIDAGRRNRARRESYIGEWLPEPVANGLLPADVAEQHSLLGLAMLRVLDDLEPEARAIFVLREAFAVPYAEIAACVGRSDAACRQVVARARRTLAAAGPAPRPPLPAEERRLMAALVAAVQAGDADLVVALLAPDCTLRSDGGGRIAAARRPILGAAAVARFLLGIAPHLSATQELRVNGGPALVFHTARGDYLYALETQNGRITTLQCQANPDKLRFAMEPEGGGRRTRLSD